MERKKLPQYLVKMQQHKVTVKNTFDYFVICIGLHLKSSRIAKKSNIMHLGIHQNALLEDHK